MAVGGVKIATSPATPIMPNSGRAEGASPLLTEPVPLPMMAALRALSAAADRGSASVYVPGQYVACTSPYPLPVYHTTGWYEPEDQLTWIAGTEGIIELLIRRPRRSYFFLLDVVPNDFGGKPQVLEVFFNYFRLASIEVPNATSLSMKVPSELFILRNTRIALHCPNATVGTSHKLPETRRLGIAVRGWCIGE